MLFYTVSAVENRKILVNLFNNLLNLHIETEIEINLHFLADSLLKFRIFFTSAAALK